LVKVYAESQSNEDAELTELVGLINKLRGAAVPPAPAYPGRRLRLKEGRPNPTYPNQVRHAKLWHKRGKEAWTKEL
jgi:hypothetical protein